MSNMNERNNVLSNIKRVLNQMKKALDRVRRQNCHGCDKRNPLFDQIESAIDRMRSLIDEYRMFSGVSAVF